MAGAGGGGALKGNLEPTTQVRGARLACAWAYASGDTRWAWARGRGGTGGAPNPKRSGGGTRTGVPRGNPAAVRMAGAKLATRPRVAPSLREAPGSEEEGGREGGSVPRPPSTALPLLVLPLPLPLALALPLPPLPLGAPPYAPPPAPPLPPATAPPTSSPHHAAVALVRLWGC
jgi:hypothetical protein